MIEIVDGLLQLDVEIFLALAVAGYVLDRPDHRFARRAIVIGKAACPDAEPLRSALAARNPHILDNRPPVPRGPRKPIDRLARFGLAGKQPRHANRDPLGNRFGKVRVLRIGIKDLAVAVGDHRPVGQAVDNGAGQRPLFRAPHEPEQPRRQRKQRKHPDNRQDTQKQDDHFGRNGVAHQRERYGNRDESERKDDHPPQRCIGRRTRHHRLGIAVLVHRGHRHRFLFLARDIRP